MRFLEPTRAVWLLAAPLAVSLLLVWMRGRRRFRAGLAEGPGLFRLSRLTGSGHEAAVLAAAVAAVVLPVIAAMRPRLASEAREPVFQRQDLVLILDRSASMHARDVAPSRLARALDEMRAFLRDRPPSVDRVALVAFAGTSLTVAHFTRDPATLLFFLDWMREDAEPRFGTDVASALGNALRLVEKDRSANRPVFVLLSDGEDHGPRLDARLSDLRRAGIRLHCIGIGTGRVAAIPVSAHGAAGGLLTDEAGQPLRTRFQADALQAMAAATGGRYYASVTGGEMAAAMRRVSESERRQVGWTTARRERDAHRPLLLAAAAALVVLLVLT